MRFSGAIRSFLNNANTTITDWSFVAIGLLFCSIIYTGGIVGIFAFAIVALMLAIVKQLKKTSNFLEKTHQDTIIHLSSHLGGNIISNDIPVDLSGLLDVWWASHFKADIIKKKLLPALGRVLKKLPKADNISIKKFDIGEEAPRVLRASVVTPNVWKNSMCVDVTIVYAPKNVDLRLAYMDAISMGITDITFTGTLRFQFIFPSDADPSTILAQSGTTVALSFLEGYEFGFKIVMGEEMQLPGVIGYATLYKLIRSQIDKNMIWPIQLRLTGPVDNIHTAAPRPMPFSYITDMSILYPSICPSPSGDMILIDKTWGEKSALLNGLLQPDSEPTSAYLCLKTNNTGHPISSLRIVNSEAELSNPNYLTVGPHRELEILEDFTDMDATMNERKPSLAGSEGRVFIQYMRGDPKKGPWITDLRIIVESDIPKLKKYADSLSSFQKNSYEFPFGYKTLDLYTISNNGSKDTVRLIFRTVNPDNSKNYSNPLPTTDNRTDKKPVEPLVGNCATRTRKLFGGFFKFPKQFSSSLSTPQNVEDETCTPEIKSFVETLCDNEESFTRFPFTSQDLQTFTRTMNEKHIRHAQRMLQTSQKFADTRTRLVPSSMP